MRRTAMALVHCMPTGGHMGRDRMKRLMKERFYWRGMDTDIAQFVQQCHSCQIAKSPKPLKPGILTEFPLMTEPWDTIHIDHVGPLPKTKEGYSYILTLIDRGTNFCMAIPVRDVKAITQARVLYEEIFCKFGIPRKIISDQGTAFKNKYIDEFIAKRLGIKLTFCTSQNPKANGKIERVHKTLKATLQAFCSHQQDEWRNVLQPFVFAMNTTSCAAIQNDTPYMLIFGRHPRHPLDLPREKQVYGSHDEQVACNLDMRHTATEMIRKRFEHLQLNSDPKHSRKTKYVSFKEGDQVLLWDDNIPKGIARKLHPR